MSSVAPVHSPTPSTSSPPTSPSGNSTAVAVGASIGVVMAFLIGASLYFFIRWRRRRNAMAELKSHRVTYIESDHPAARVTPFRSGAPFGPSFEHNPGEGMRVARRRDDGGWEFSDPLDFSATPIVKPYDFTSESPLPSPSSTVFSHSPYAKKEPKIPGQLTTRGYIEIDHEGLPPPAYCPSRTSLGSYAV
ncbi:hypothetical protein C8Q75DRAFT_786084 [Abortiporus biennis]|nr:hypothetical protein C8Q75DRAFT_786084 [Abortiporus biennis]